MGCDLVEDTCKEDSCSRLCHQVCPSLCTSYSPPPPPDHISHSISTNLIIMACVLSTAFLLGICWILILNLYSKWKASRRLRVMNSNSTRVLSRTDGDFLDGNNNHRRVVEHHVWYINTVGLQQSVIDSINAIKFKKNEGLVDGTECSVCLSAFEDDETLRLLPKCNHAFHLPCIDTWLRSHKNCPLCRAPVVRESSGGELSPDDSRSTEDPQLENNDLSGRGSDLLDEDGVSEMSSRSERLDETQVGIERISSGTAMIRHVPRQEVEQVRRSVSLDSSSASVIYRAVADAEEREVLKSLNPQRALAKSGSGSTSRASADEGSSVYRFMKRSMVLKKSLSSNGKFLALSPTHKRSQTSILPL